MANPPPLPDFRKKKTASLKYLEPGKVQRLEGLMLRIQHLVEGALMGKHASAFKGPSVEFVEYRRYNPGDPVSDIDWKVFARTDREYVRETRQEATLPCYLVLDHSTSMAFAGLGKRKNTFSKLEYAKFLMGALAYLVVRQQDQVALSVFSQRVTESIPLGGTMSHVYQILTALELHAAKGVGNIGKLLDQLVTLHRRRGLLVLASDFYDDVDAMFQRLMVFRQRGFDILLMHILHPDELELPSFPNVLFKDMELKQSLSCRPRDLKASYDAGIQEHIESMRTYAQKRGMHYHLVNTGEPYEDVLQAYLMNRSQMKS